MVFCAQQNMFHAALLQQTFYLNIIGILRSYDLKLFTAEADNKISRLKR